MAVLIYGFAKCSICRRVVSEGDDIVATTHFIADEADPLWRFSDSVMHRSCYDKWEHREEFQNRYHKALARLYPGSHYETWPAMHPASIGKDQQNA